MITTGQFVLLLLATVPPYLGFGNLFLGVYVSDWYREPLLIRVFMMVFWPFFAYVMGMWNACKHVSFWFRKAWYTATSIGDTQ